MPALSPEKKEALLAARRNEGVLYHGMEVLGGGAILGGLILTAVAVFIIDRNFGKAAAFALAGGVLTFFDFMHGERIGVAESPVVAGSYAAMAVVLVLCAQFAVAPARPKEDAELPVSASERLPAGSVAAVGD